MRAYVFTDKALERQAGRFVWLTIDTEKRQNAEFRTRFPVQALPTFFVLDPATEKVALRWVGGATVSQLEKILEDGRRAVAAGIVADTKAPAAGTSGAPKSGTAAAAAALARADRLYGEGKNDEAAGAYQEALAAAPSGWPGYGRCVESLLFALDRTKDYETAARLARDAFLRLRKTPSAANVAASGLGSALQLPEDHGQRRELVLALEADARLVVTDPKLPVAADDRSGVYIALLDARQDAKDSLGARDVAVRWAAFLEGEAARAKNPDARAVFDSHRLSAYIELGQAERGVPMLQASERDMPDDYNPPARLAIAYKELGRWDEALAASDRALAKAYGPRRLVVLQARADIHKGRGDVAAARKTLEDAIREAEDLPPGQKNESTIAALRKKLEALPPLTPTDAATRH